MIENKVSVSPSEHDNVYLYEELHQNENKEYSSVVEVIV